MQDKSISYEIVKESNIEKGEVVLTVKIKVKKMDGYDGFDLFPDDKIPDLILAVSRMLNHDKKWSDIFRKFRG